MKPGTKLFCKGTVAYSYAPSPGEEYAWEKFERGRTTFGIVIMEAHFLLFV